MAEITTFPTLQTYRPWEPPVAPFHWRKVNMGPVNFEFLFDAHGRQVFNGSSAIWRTSGAATQVASEDHHPENKEGGSDV